jgi:transcriptional regulator with XRE-family HTH domain
MRVLNGIRTNCVFEVLRRIATGISFRSYNVSIEASRSKGYIVMSAFAEAVLPSSVIPPKRPRGATSKASPGMSELPTETVIPDHDPTLADAQVGVSAEAAESFIEDKRIGERIKYLRQRKQMGLVELGRHTGLSASFLSQLETGRVVPTLRNLARIAMVFSKDMSYFFEPEKTELFRVIRAADRQRMPQTGAEEPGYYFESLGHVPADQPIAPYVAEFLPGNEKRVARAHRHAGNEFLFVLSGCLQLTHDSKSDMLEDGDAVFFNAEAVHSYERVGDESCTALILTMPEALRGNHSGSKLALGKKK